jgi:hypothetical protein
MANRIANIIGNNENAFSIAVALCLCYEKELFGWLLKKCGINDKCGIKEITTEKNLGSIENRIDIYISLTNGFRIGIENKKWAVFQKDQIERYLSSSSFSDYSRSKLLVLTPSRYCFDNVELPASIVKVTYKEIINVLKLLPAPKNAILIDVIEYFSEVEMMPFSGQEIDAMRYFPSANSKFISVLESIRKDNDWGIENSPGQYKLFGREMGGYTFYYGFRFGNDWYIKYPLLNGTPECIIYLRKYSGSTNIIEQLLIKNMEKFNLIKTGNEKMEILDGDVRLMIRKNLGDFADHDLDDIAKWFSINGTEIESSFT